MKLKRFAGEIMILGGMSLFAMHKYLMFGPGFQFTLVIGWALIAAGFITLIWKDVKQNFTESSSKKYSNHGKMSPMILFTVVKHLAVIQALLFVGFALTSPRVENILTANHLTAALSVLYMSTLLISEGLADMLIEYNVK